MSHPKSRLPLYPEGVRSDPDQTTIRVSPSLCLPICADLDLEAILRPAKSSLRPKRRKPSANYIKGEKAELENQFLDLGNKIDILHTIFKDIDELQRKRE